MFEYRYVSRIVGFKDDKISLKNRNHLGIRCKKKLLTCITVICIVEYQYFSTKSAQSSETYRPILQKLKISSKMNMK